MSLLESSVHELTVAFAAKRLSPVEIAKACLRQVALVEPVLNAFVVREDEEVVLREARAAEARWMRGAPQGPLDGVPINVKDAIITVRWPTRNGSYSTSDQPHEADAPAVARVREAGALIIGKTTTPEYGWKAVTDCPLTGVSRNPWNTDMSPGGSSGGAAAAVAAGETIAAIGTDAGGSVRIPAAFCGLVALKATRGRIPAFPVSFVWTLGHIGPIARTVEDVALLLDVMARPDARDWNALPPPSESYAAALRAEGDLKGLRIAYSPTLGHAKVDPEVARITAVAAARFAALGAHVEEVEAPLPNAREDFAVYFQTCLSHSLRHLSPEAMAKLDPGLARVIDFGRSISRERFIGAYEFQIRISREARLFNERYDLLLTPTTAVPAFAAGRLSPDGYDQSDWLDWAPFTYPFNLTGQPALSINGGYTAGGLPVGIQLVGPMYGEALLLRVARAFEVSMKSETRKLPISH